MKDREIHILIPTRTGSAVASLTGKTNGLVYCGATDVANNRSEPDVAAAKKGAEEIGGGLCPGCLEAEHAEYAHPDTLP